jgi:hypothetical protein
MPSHFARACKHPLCPMLTKSDNGYCTTHESLAEQRRMADSRPNANERGYGASWRRIRERTLRLFGIPMHAWHLYDIDHEPAYDKARDPDHTHYRLTPRLHGEHASKTASADGGFGNPKR